jgi:hypothetical protein
VLGRTGGQAPAVWGENLGSGPGVSDSSTAGPDVRGEGSLVVGGVGEPKTTPVWRDEGLLAGMVSAYVAGKMVQVGLDGSKAIPMSVARSKPLLISASRSTTR